MGKQKLKLSSVKGYRKKRKAKLAASLTCESVASSNSSNPDTDLVVSLPLLSFTHNKVKGLMELHDRLSKNGIPGWNIVESTSERLSLAKMKFSPPRISVSVQISSNFEYCVTLEGYTINLPQLEAPIGSRISCVNDVIVLLNTINTFHLCEGNLCSEFPDLVVHNKGKFYGTDRKLYFIIYLVLHYINIVHTGKTLVANIVTNDSRQTIRHRECQVIVKEGVIRCTKCAAHRKTLQSTATRLHSRARNDASRSPTSHTITSPSSHANLDYLTAPEVSLRVQALQSRLKSSNKLVSQLQERIKKLTETQGLNVEQDLHDDLVTVMDQHEDSVSKQYDEDSFQMIFWRQQRQAIQKGTGVRWHPLFIKWCLYLHHCSSGAYKVLRNSKCLCLPSERTLRDYTHFNSTGAGFSDATDSQLKEYAKLDESPNHKNLVGLLFDEIHIKEGLVFDKNTGNLIGFADLGDINNDFIRYSNSDSDGESKLPLAKSVMFIMVRGLTSRLTFPYAQFPVESIKGSQLFPLFWEAVHRLEFMGFRVLSCTCDGATSNRRLYHLLTQSQTDKYKVLNKYSEDQRYIYLFSDPPHLIKTIRNCFSTRPLWVSTYVVVLVMLFSNQLCFGSVVDNTLVGNMSLIYTSAIWELAKDLQWSTS